MVNYVKKLLLVLCVLVCNTILIAAETNENNNVRILNIEEFIKTAVEKDTVFEQILIDELALKYKKDLSLPSGDLVLSVKNQYEFKFLALLLIIVLDLNNLNEYNMFYEYICA